MKNKWIKIILVSTILFVLELLVVLFYFRPYILRYKIFDSIENGSYVKAEKYYGKLDDEDKEAVNKKIGDYITYLADSYYKGEMSYDDISASFNAIKTIYEGYDKSYESDINANELVKTTNDLYKSEMNKDTDAIYKGRDNLNKLMLKMDNNTRESLMISLLCDKYIQYLDGHLSAEGMKTYAYLVREMSYYSAYDLAKRIYHNVDTIEWYKLAYDRAEQLSLEKNYVGALRLINQTDIDASDDKYREKFKTLYDTTYALGKRYYEDLFEKYADMKDNDAALKLLAELSDVYKDEFDISGLEGQLANGWQNAYMAFFEDWDANLRADIGDTETGQYILDNAYDLVWPDSVCLFDVDDDGTPEAFLFNSDRLGDDYIESFMYHYNGEKAEYLGYVNVISFCVNSNLLTFPRAFERTTGEEYALTAYDGTMIGIMTYCQNINGDYYVDGEDAEEYEFLTAKTDILQYQSRYNIANAGHAGLDEAKSFILTYK